MKQIMQLIGGKWCCEFRFRSDDRLADAAEFDKRSDAEAWFRNHPEFGPEDQ